MKLPEAIRDELSQGAAAGHKVFATEVLRENMRAAKAKPRKEEPPKEEPTKEEPDNEYASNVEQVIDELNRWLYRCSDLLEDYGFLQQASEFCFAVRDALCPLDEDEASEQENERPKNKWFNFRKGSDRG